jgi:quercetin dioxygenase-like cupin family protein
MALHHATSGELIDIRPLGDATLRWAKSRALFKTGHLEVSRIVLKSDEEVPPHEVPGDTTIQCLDGTLQATAGTTTQSMQAGDLICIARGERFSIRATATCSFLMTMVLHAAE